MSETKIINDDLLGGKSQSWWHIISYNLSGVGTGAAFVMISSFLFYFYEVELLLPAGLVTAALVILGVWDAINDPLVGYVSDKKYWFTKKWGRRFPWIIFGAIPVTILTFFIFSPPWDATEKPYLVFFYLIVLLLIYELFASFSYVNKTSLYAQKFRTNQDRRRSTAVSLVFMVIVMFMGSMLPYMFIVEGEPSTYLTAIIVLMAVAIPFILLGIPGTKETPEMWDQTEIGKEKMFKKDFFATFKELLKNRNFVAMIVTGLPVTLVGALAQGSIIYYAMFVIDAGIPGAQILTYGYLAGSVVAIPFWMPLFKKFGFKKCYVVSTFGIGLVLLPLLFTNSIVLAGICGVLTGFFKTGLDGSDEPLFAIVQDEDVINVGYRREGAFNGVKYMIAQISYPVSILIFYLLHVLSGFDPSIEPGEGSQSASAQFGIRLGISLLPFLMATIGGLLFLKLWKMTPEREHEIKVELMERNL